MQIPFSIDFAIIEESEEEEEGAFFLFDSSSSQLSLQTQMRIRLLTGLEFTEIIRDRCRFQLDISNHYQTHIHTHIQTHYLNSHSHSHSHSRIDSTFINTFEKRFFLKKKGYSSREVTMGVSLLSNLLASISIHPITLTTVYESCTTNFQWSLFSHCNSTMCFYSSYSCGYQEGFALLVLAHWNVDIARQLYISLVYSLSNTV